MPSFVDISTMSKVTSITGNEEFQVSATNKIRSRDIASLALTQQLHGFSEVTLGSPRISSTSLLLPAIAALYRLSSDNGKILPISNGIDKFGNVVFSGTNAVGILFDVKASKYFTRSGVTATAFFSSAHWISWLQDGEAHEMGGGAVPSGGLAPGTVIFNDEFSFGGCTNANPGQLSLLQPIPLGSIVTFIGSYSFGPPGEEILLSPDSRTWSLTVVLPTGASDIEHYLKDMLVVQNPETNWVVVRQSAVYKIGAKNLVNGKISTIDMYALGALLSDMYLTINQIIYVAQV
jgi:hypothetical protein